MDQNHKAMGGDDPNGAEAPGVEAPPVIGQDERRMHVRAYNFWAKLLKGNAFPDIAALDIANLGDFGPHSVLLDFATGIDNPTIAHVGALLAAECDLSPEVTRIADVPRRSLLSRLTDHYLQIHANRAPIGFEAEFVNGRDATILYRGVLLPFSSGGDQIDFILGVINWKEAAEPELSLSLVKEMAAAGPALPKQAPTIPIWADGPAPLSSEMLSSGDVASPPPNAEALRESMQQARIHADAANDAASRAENVLIDALSDTWSFALLANDAPDSFADLLRQAGIASNGGNIIACAVELVFGSGDASVATADFARILEHAKAEGMNASDLAVFLRNYPGGLTALTAKLRGG